MSHTSIELAVKHAYDNNEKLERGYSYEGVHMNKGVLVSLWWEYGGRYQRRISESFYRSGKIYTSKDMSTLIGEYQEPEPLK